MAKKVSGFIKLQIQAGQANPAPPVGPALGQQWRASALGGHVGGSMDSALLGLKEAPKTWHCAEFKTHNKKSFDDLEKKRVRKAKPMHFKRPLNKH